MKISQSAPAPLSHQSKASEKSRNYCEGIPGIAKNVFKKFGVYSRLPKKREMSGNMGNIETLGDLEVFLCLKRADLLQYYDK